MMERPLSIWAVSDGRVGIERQALSVMHALRELAPLGDSRVVRLTPGEPQLSLPADMWPFPKLALPPEQRAILDGELPDVWIACGRRSIPYSIGVRKWSAGGTFTVQLQDPRVSATKFDLVVPPEHDGLIGENVISTVGAPIHYPQSAIDAAAVRFPEYGADPSPRVLVVLGGDSKTHTMAERRAIEIERLLSPLPVRDIKLWITTSRRTPAHAVARFRAFAETYGARFWANEAQDGPNPYLAMLHYCDAVLVTEDSTNMITDAAWFGKPGHLLKLDGGSSKFDRLHQGFFAKHATRWFKGQIARWPFPPVREANFVAQEILDRLALR